MKPAEILRDGTKILNPFLNANGFTFTSINGGESSGGNFASGKYIKGNRTIELHYRYGLGLVSYHIGDKHLYHIDYIKLIGLYGNNRYPGFSANPLQPFNDLLYDLENFFKDFISGDGSEFIKLVEKFEQNPDIFKGFKRLTNGYKGK